MKADTDPAVTNLQMTRLLLEHCHGYLEGFQGQNRKWAFWWSQPPSEAIAVGAKLAIPMSATKWQWCLRQHDLHAQVPLL